ncbi:MAG: DUF1573 domain-containing protein [Bacteroidales bacterium]|jgi:hypothetical protein|nr:DUF1573 domain-containing protein [Bacteroidales bacterium]
MKKQLLSFVLFLSALSLFAQPAIQFESTTIDFGNVKEEGGKVSGKFEFTNTGDQDLLLSSVKPGCGCTAADYTKTAIAPGQKGFIIATYDPFNRPGSFNKNIKVTTNEPKFKEGANGSPYMIYIKGNVEKRPPSKYETAGYKNGIGNIRIKDNNLKFDLFSTESQSSNFLVMNFSEKESTFEPVNLPNYITLEKTTLKPGEEKELSLTYNAAKRGEIGVFKDVVNIQTQDSIEPRITLFVESAIKEDFSKLTPKQLQDAPKAFLDSLNIDFGKIDKNTNPTRQIQLYNKGKNPLIIRQLKSSTSVFSIASDITEIPKDGFSTLTITLSTRNRRGVQNATIEIVTNDPANPLLILNCKSDISQ